MNFDGFGQEATTYAPVSVYDDMLELSVHRIILTQRFLLCFLG